MARTIKNISNEMLEERIGNLEENKYYSISKNVTKTVGAEDGQLPKVRKGEEPIAPEPTGSDFDTLHEAFRWVELQTCHPDATITLNLLAAEYEVCENDGIFELQEPVMIPDGEEDFLETPINRYDINSGFYTFRNINLKLDIPVASDSVDLYLKDSEEFDNNGLPYGLNSVIRIEGGSFTSNSEIMFAFDLSDMSYANTLKPIVGNKTNINILTCTCSGTSLMCFQDSNVNIEDIRFFDTDKTVLHLRNCQTKIIYIQFQGILQYDAGIVVHGGVFNANQIKGTDCFALVGYVDGIYESIIGIIYATNCDVVFRIRHPDDNETIEYSVIKISMGSYHPVNVTSLHDSYILNQIGFDGGYISNGNPLSFQSGG